MSSPDWPYAALGTSQAVEWLLPALAAVVAAIGLARWARALGLLDSGGGHGLHREAHGAGKCLVGGLAVAVGLALSAGLAGGTPAAFPGELPALFLALWIGLVDDRSRTGLGARAKLVLQLLPAAALAWWLWDADPRWAALCFGLALAAQNLANTYDNADGVLLLSAALALAPARPAASAILGGVLIFNLHRRRPAGVLLGDSGSHLIALLLVCEPRAWGALLLPALDLARVVCVRRAQGRAWWIGDRVHLAHRLAARGLGPGAVALSLAAAGAPAMASSAFAHGALAWSLGLCASAAAFALLVRATPAVDGRGQPLRGVRSDSPPAAEHRAP